MAKTAPNEQQPQQQYTSVEKKLPSTKYRGSRTTDKLSEERLARKRAADRNSQRMLREKTKRHIEELEQKVAELSDTNGHKLALEKARTRTFELEAELKELRAIYDLRSTDDVTRATFHAEDNIGNYPANDTQVPTKLRPQYTIRRGLVKQPALHVWEHPLANKEPSNPIEYVMSSAVQQQKLITSNGGKNALAVAKGPIFPDISALIKPQAPTAIHPLSGILSDMLRRLTYRTFVDKIAALLVVYPIFQWQIANDYDSYAALPSYSIPTLLQRTIPHPIWVCAVGWPKLRDVLIQNQEQYCTEEFQYKMVHSLNCNWPYGTEAAIQRTRSGFSITKEFWDHVRVMDNWTLNEPFQSRYPELERYCRFSKDPVNSILEEHVAVT